MDRTFSANHLQHVSLPTLLPRKGESVSGYVSAVYLESLTGHSIALLSIDVVSLTGRMRHTMIRGWLSVGLVLAGLGACMPGWSSTARTGRYRSQLASAEQSLHRVPAHISEFTPMSQPLAIPRCGDVRPPEALATPDPLLLFDQDDHPVRVSFIVGADGRVHSAFILDSGGARDDQVVLRTVRRWRYRPAMCNGVPTDSEARVRFDIQ